MRADSDDVGRMARLHGPVEQLAADKVALINAEVPEKLAEMKGRGAQEARHKLDIDTISLRYLFDIYLAFACSSMR